MSKLQKIAVVFLLIAVITGILHKTGVFYVQGLTALTLCVGLLNLVVGGFEIYDYVIRL